MKSFVTLMARALVKVTPKLSVLVMGSLICFGQGTFKVYDQQVPWPPPGIDHSDGIFFDLISRNSPFGQNFVPRLSEVHFVELSISNLGRFFRSAQTETVVVNLREGGLEGRLLGSTEPVTFIRSLEVDPFICDFFFPTPVAVVPGQVYFFELVHVSGDDLVGVATASTDLPSQGYRFGELTRQGTKRPYGDLWFREGILIPEPGIGVLIAVGGMAVWWRWRTARSARHRPPNGRPD